MKEEEIYKEHQQSLRQQGLERVNICTNLFYTTI